MKNDNNLKIGIEGSCLFSKSDGPGVYTNNLIESLALIEKKDLFYVYYPNAPIFRKSSLNVKQHNIKPKRFYFGLNFTKGLDIYHDTSMAFFYSSAAASPAKKNIATIHDTDSLVNEGWMDPLQQKISLKKLRTAISILDAVITPSETSKHGLIKHFNVSASKISVIRPGIESFFCPATTYQKSLVKARYAISEKYIIFSGKIEERKNLRSLLEAYSTLKYESPPLLVFAGDVGWLKDGILDMARSFGVEKNVRVLGFVPRSHLPALMGGALFMVRPSLYDGFALPVLEAMACGCPVITSSTSAAAEITGNASLLVDPYDIENIASAMRRLMTDEELRTNLEEKGLKHATEYSSAKMARETLQLYRKVAGI